MSKIYVLFWFDVEDYITPESDSALMRLVEIFDKHNVKGIFKFVGEKIRVLEERGRLDIIERVSAHDIGYHTDNHSQHPTISEYLEGMGWDEGAEEFHRRERRGMDDLERIFGKRVSNYGQPGSAWAPQVYQVLKEWGVPVYLDEAQQVGLNEQPFWYCGILNVLRMRSNCTRVSLRKSDDALPEGKAAFDRIYNRLKQDGGTISIFYHPCEFATIEFWDGVNFNKGKQTPREKWRPARLRSNEDSEWAYRTFNDYLAYIKSHPQVEIITATELTDVYRDRAVGRTFSTDEILRLAQRLEDEIGYQIIDGVALSPAEIFHLITSSLATYYEAGQLPESVQFFSPIGPTVRVAGSMQDDYIALDDLIHACAGTAETVNEKGRLPDAINLENGRMSLADFLATTAGAFLEVIRSANAPDRIKVRRGNFALEKYVTGEGCWGWSIFPEGFDAPGLIELGKLQTWSLKPALLYA